MGVVALIVRSLVSRVCQDQPIGETRAKLQFALLQDLRMADYHVLDIGDVSFAGAVRWDVKVTVEPEATRDEELDIARSIALNFRESRP